MQYLVQMKPVPQVRRTTSEEGQTFIARYISPSLERCKKLQDEEKILAGGPSSGSRMKTAVTPLATFQGRAESLRPRLEQGTSTAQRDLQENN
jgi:hypothetical protein